MSARLLRSRSAGALALLLCACTDPWRAISHVDGLRILSIRAEPPDLAPGEFTRLEAMVVDSRDPSRANTLVWFACDPDPSSPDQPACAKYGTLEEIGEGALDAGSHSLPEGVRLLGMTPPPGAPALPLGYQARADVFDTLAHDDARRSRGVLAIVLVLAIAAPPPSWPPTPDAMQSLLAKVNAKEVDSLLGVKRIRISENAVRNRNPALLGVRIGDTLWGADSHAAKLQPGITIPMAGVASDGSAEHYSDLDANGKPVEKDEKLFVSWFATFGELELARTLAGASGETGQALATPFIFSKIPEDRRGSLWLILRDGRGGVDAMLRPLFLCDPLRGPPLIDTIEPASVSPGATLKVRGNGLEDLLDVQVGPSWLADLRWDPVEGALTGVVPADLLPGDHTLVPRGKGCGADPQAILTVIGQ